MKKRLLITSIVMMLVVAVALSTATYAWFTSNANVTANNISVTAATSNAPALTIAWDAASPTFGTSLTGINAPAAFYPIAPATLNKTSGEESLASQLYYNATVRTESNDVKFNGDAQLKSWSEGNDANYATPYYLSTGSGESKVESIILKNDSTSNTMNTITFSADIIGSAANLIRIAVYKEGSGAWTLVDVLGYEYAYSSTPAAAYVANTLYYEKDAHNNYQYVEIANEAAFTAATTGENAKTLYARTGIDETVGKEAIATYGVITKDKSVSTMSNYTCAHSFDVGSLAAQATMKLKVVIWMDGLALNDDTAQFAGVVNLKFAA